MPRTSSKIAWDYDKRLILHLLCDEFELPWSQASDVFLSIYEDIVAADVGGALRSQYSERRSKQYWKDFYNLVSTPGENERTDASRRLISERIATLGIVIPPGTDLATRSRTQSVSHAVPLSRQPAIAMPTTPEPPIHRSAGNSSQKRRRLEDESSDDEIRVGPLEEHVHQQDFQSRIHPRSTVRPVLETPPQTPQGKQAYRQMSGKVIFISPNKDPYADLEPVSDEEAHPPHCRNNLFFRYDKAGSHDVFEGFTARRYRGRVQVHQEPPATLDWTDVFYHVDPEGKNQRYDSPVVSVTDQQWWVIRLALKELNRGRPGRITVIDGSALDPKAVFHALPFIRQLKKRHEFTDGAWNYGGTHEFFCFKSIPAHAILSSFCVSELSNFVNGSPQMSSVLRLATLSDPKRAYFKGVLPALKRDNVQLSPNVITEIARLIQFMGLDAFSKREHLAHIWTNFIQGWGLHLSYQTPDQWVKLAAGFARALGDVGGHVLPSRDSKPLELAFLEGVNWASSVSFSTRYAQDSALLIRRKDRQARFIGLEDPAGLLEIPNPNTAIRTLQAYRHQPGNGEGSRRPTRNTRPVFHSYRLESAGGRANREHHDEARRRAIATGRTLQDAIDLDQETDLSDDEEEILYDD